MKKDYVRTIIKSYNMVTVEVYDTLSDKYKFINVSPDVAACLNESQREIWRIDKEIERKTYSFDSALYEGSDYGYDDDYFAPTEAEQLALDSELSKRAKKAWASLTPTQYRRVKLFQLNLKMVDIAQKEGVTEQSVSESIEAAYKKMRKIIKQKP